MIDYLYQRYKGNISSQNGNGRSGSRRSGNEHDIFLMFAQNIDIGNTLAPPKNEKTKMNTLVNPSLTIEKLGVRGYYSHGHVILMS